jgi:hypothetical protein
VGGATKLYGAALIPPSRRPVHLICSHRCLMSHVSRNYTTTWRRPASIRPRRPPGSSSMSKPPTRAPAFAVTRAMAFPAWCTPKPMPKSSVCARPWPIPMLPW